MQFLAFVRYICDNLGFFFRHSLRLRYKKQMQQITPSPLLRLSSFPNSYNELFTMSHIHCALILYILSLYPWFSAFHTSWLTEWTWEHLCFPGCRNLDEVTQLHLRASMGQCLPCSFHCHSGIQEGLRLVVQSELWHTLGRVYTWAAVCSCSWSIPLPSHLM